MSVCAWVGPSIEKIKAFFSSLESILTTTYRMPPVSEVAVKKAGCFSDSQLL